MSAPPFSHIIKANFSFQAVIAQRDPRTLSPATVVASPAISPVTARSPLPPAVVRAVVVAASLVPSATR